MSEPQRDYKDQAEPLRKHMSRVESRTERKEGDLPSRKDIHRHRKKKKRGIQMTFPLVRLLLMTFILIVLLLIFSPYWLNL
ncbi:hypothetical protein M3689_03865 [Alkalihalophilus marmarensis]|jgi:hypothetical protein|uniref:Uncharacterized protein n=1 Tax=Alkalihalophilus marmarensis DSM 21297 TaxID=1188261 RepID=U6ST90_9BACI|nr:hypothetical protein [Alkalihalophilus marmarensis]ERN54135.1 hypothetical protein A33I_06845 [Alkalihalophilus marmarensis DSM 21297]MCM3488442.1 hypothetical protein [Alkalihalophilus marmarensis]